MPRLMTNETIHIRNFAGLTDVRLDLKPVTVLIGPQASGKSVCAKLAFFFKESIRRLAVYILDESSQTELEREEHRLFLSYFPPESWSSGSFEITYSFGALVITARRTTSESAAVEIKYSDYYDDLFEAGRAALKQLHKDEEPPIFDVFGLRAVRHALDERISAEISPVLANPGYFIPAGRSFFATVRSNVFSLISEQTEIDPFLVEFGRLYERVRKRYPPSSKRSELPPIARRIEVLLGGRYVRLKGDDFIRMPDGRRIPIAVSSSGQQELLPLAITLGSMSEGKGVRARSTLYVEEPEAHLFPTAQRQIVHLFAAVTDLLSTESSSQYIITTHSPYILAALNNLTYGGKIAREDSTKREEVFRLLGPDVLIGPEKVGAYAMENGGARSIIDAETMLVEATLIDRVSGDLAREFEQLVSIEFGGETA